MGPKRTEMAPGARRCCELRLFIADIMLCWQSASAQDASWRSRDLPLPRWHPHRQGEEENHREVDKMLFDAVHDNNISAVRKTLADGADPDGYLCDWSGTALWRASRDGHVDVARLLLENWPASAAVDHRNSDGSTPLHASIYNGHIDVVHLLLFHGADPLIPNIDNDNAYRVLKACPHDKEYKDNVKALLQEYERKHREAHAANAEAEAEASKAAEAAAEDGDAESEL